MNFDIILGVVILGVLGFLTFKYKETIKRKLQDRVEKNAVKIPDLTYKDRKGNVIVEDIIVKRSAIPIIGDWGRIYPPVDEYGNTNWVNLLLGGKKNLIKLLILMGLLVLIFLWVWGILGAGAEYLDGSKYVIISKELFNQYCVPIGDGIIEELKGGNITVYE